MTTLFFNVISPCLTNTIIARSPGQNKHKIAAGGKGVIVKGMDPAYPYFSIFWKQGEFHSVKLYVHRDLQHESWGTLRLVPDISDKFDIDSLELDF